MIVHDFYGANDLFGSIIQKGEPASILRIDNTASYGIQQLVHGKLPSKEYVNENSLVEGGITPPNLHYLFDVVWRKTFDLMLNSDVLGMVDISGNIARDVEYLTSNFQNKHIFFEYFVVDPIALLGVSNYGPVNTPWPSYLKGKKVLALSSHANTIKHQWKNIDLIWGKNRDLIAPFELVDAISTPYHPLIDDRQYPNCENFEQLVQITKERIDQYDYDVLLTGITTQSPFYVDHAKKMGKIGIQTGGVLQLFFGILGERWAGPNTGYKNWDKMYNEYWMYPLDIDEPQKRKQMQDINLETSYAYWKRT